MFSKLFIYLIPFYILIISPYLIFFNLTQIIMNNLFTIIIPINIINLIKSIQKFYLKYLIQK